MHPTDLAFTGGTDAILTFHPDGRMTVGETWRNNPDEAAQAILAAMGSYHLAQAEREAKLREALASAIHEASLLHQNSMGCADNHYGEDMATFGVPGWLNDSAVRIAAARAALAKAEGDKP